MNPSSRTLGGKVLVSNLISRMSEEEKVQPSAYPVSSPQAAQAALAGETKGSSPLSGSDGAPWQPVIAALWQVAVATVWLWWGVQSSLMGRQLKALHQHCEHLN